MEKRTIQRLAVAGGLILLAVFAVFAVLVWGHRAEILARYVEFRQWADAWLRQVNPVVFFALLAVVPIVPVPVSIFYLGSGIFPWPVATAGLLIAIPINFTLTYWLARSFMHPLAVRLLARAGKTIPKPSSDKNEILFCILIRVCGTPYTLQNYLIPLAGVKFRRYMLLGLPFQYIPAFAMMLVGDSLLKGQAGKAVLGIGILVAVGIFAKLAKDWLERRRTARGEVGNA